MQVLTVTDQAFVVYNCGVVEEAQKAGLARKELKVHKQFRLALYFSNLTVFLFVFD